MRRVWTTNCIAVKLVLLTSLCGLLLAAAPARAQLTYSVVYAFTGAPDGANPSSGNLVRSGENLYGTTQNGGADGFGTVFDVITTGSEKWRYSFGGPPDGANPYGGLILAKGNLYGTTVGGGVSDTYSCTITQFGGCGTIFEAAAKTGAETILYRFTGALEDGENPYAGLVSDSKGNLYGTTNYGGGFTDGTVFEFSSGSEFELYSFCPSGCSGGSFPEAALVRKSNGNLYGTTADGGSGCGSQGCGVVFELTSTSEQVLYAFQGQPDGAQPRSSLVMHAGSFYGTTNFGGSNGTGTVFKLSAKPNKGCPSGSNLGNDWCETVLYSFCAQPSCSDGGYPFSGLLFDAEGNAYGTTSFGGSDSQGTVFKLFPEPSEGCPSGSNTGNAWCETILYNFMGGSDGANPTAGLISDKEGNLYGTTENGGSTNCSGGCGVVFKLTPTS